MSFVKHFVLMPVGSMPTKSVCTLEMSLVVLCDEIRELIETILVVIIFLTFCQ